ncbi:MAG: undecaprenyldiphospho-muramoylpentapeptide beta-N-acetylglucosaminyltransferase [Maricaulaceae bacterium]|jgi:UDP-N-acetylglucosamine--N-acetylmuramyl-(pentapeptide) pyrophosphoryl-undecaprenol N-acetylglucosamine transferase
MKSVLNPAKQAVLAAGGTGGHMFPAQALAAELAKRGWSIALVTDARGLALAKDFPADPIAVIDAATISPANPFKSIVGAMKIAGGYTAARRIIKDLKPSVVIGFGGYPAFPTLMAARGKAKIVLHEQNAVLGRVNRAFAARAHAIASGFKRLERMPQRATGRWVITGNPVRAHITEARDTPYVTPEGDAPINLVILGGSLGARILSEIPPRAVARLPEDLRRRLKVVQQTREEWVEDALQVYREAGVEAVCQPFFTNIGELLAKAHMVIARAGASTVTEIAVAGRPSILVPLAIAMDDHQTLNAEALADVGAADVIPEREFDGEALTKLLADRLSHPETLARRADNARAAGRADAASALADVVLNVAKGVPV